MSSDSKIHALSEHTVTRLGSAQIVQEPWHAVKELLDNALDAGSSSVHVDISANSLDWIQVRDNGHGIAPEDRPMACRRYCTSKIRDFADITVLGGTSMGFRGEALNSIAALSGTLLVVTRVESESTAVKLSFDSKGEICK